MNAAKIRRQKLTTARACIAACASAFYDALDAENTDAARSVLVDLRASIEAIEEDLLPIPYSIGVAFGVVFDSAGPDVECITCTKPCHSVKGRSAPMCDDCFATMGGNS